MNPPLLRWKFVQPRMHSRETEFHPSDFGKNSIRISGGGRFIRRPCPPCYIRKIRSIRKIARLDGKVQIERRSPNPPSPRLASDNRSLIAFVIPIINNASIVARRGWRWVAGELNALTRIIGLRWMVNGKYTGTAVIEYKTRLLRSIIRVWTVLAFDTNV